MTPSVSLAATSTPNTPLQPAVPAEYQAGVCNIGPEEIARRRRAGHIGLVISIAVFVGLVLAGCRRRSSGLSCSCRWPRPPRAISRRG